ncbi:hypothetical protein NZA98_39205, partial [Escherichia coli]|nr:hypothetical protein [Escherichia coli]
MFSCLVLTNCQSSSGVDDVLAQRPSQEMTSSVVRPSRSVTRIAMATVPPSPVPQQEILAWAGPVPESAAILPP